MCCQHGRAHACMSAHFLRVIAFDMGRATRPAISHHISPFRKSRCARSASNAFLALLPSSLARSCLEIGPHRSRLYIARGGLAPHFISILVDYNSLATGHHGNLQTMTIITHEPSARISFDRQRPGSGSSSSDTPNRSATFPCPSSIG